jgi:hypothetical protein
MKNKDFYTKELPLHCVAFVWKLMDNYSKRAGVLELRAMFTANVYASGLRITPTHQSNANCVRPRGK